MGRGGAALRAPHAAPAYAERAERAAALHGGLLDHSAPPGRFLLITRFIVDQPDRARCAPDLETALDEVLCLFREPGHWFIDLLDLGPEDEVPAPVAVKLTLTASAETDRLSTEPLIGSGAWLARARACAARTGRHLQTPLTDPVQRYLVLQADASGSLWASQETRLSAALTGIDGLYRMNWAFVALYDLAPLSGAVEVPVRFTLRVDRPGRRPLVVRE